MNIYIYIYIIYTVILQFILNLYMYYVNMYVVFIVRI